MTWGFLRETQEKAIKAGIDEDTGLERTGLDTYLNEIFPNETFVHDEELPDNIARKFRPDYYCKKSNLIVEFDGIQHYTKSNQCIKDICDRDAVLKEHGYKVVHIPYFIQLTREVIKTMFHVDVGHEMFPEGVPSMGKKGHNLPVHCCVLGLSRMAKEFLKYPEQYETNMNYLKSLNDNNATAANELEALYNYYKNQAGDK